jgi:hypothetical protein
MDKNGAPVELRAADKLPITFGNDGWWTLKFADGRSLRAADCAATFKRDGDRLTCQYTSPRVDVKLVVECGERELELRATLEPKEEAVTTLALPAQILFSPAQIEQVHFPCELGRALKRPFFELQTGEQSATWKQRSIGPVGANAVGVSVAKMLPYDGPEVAVEVPPEGKPFLGKLEPRLASWKLRCPRPPERKPELTILSTANGPLFSLESVGGGSGYFLRWGGLFTSGESQSLQRMVTHSVLRELLRKTEGKTAPKSIAVIDLPGALHGQPGEWTRAMQQLGIPVRTLNTPDEIPAALSSRTDWLIVNPYPELLPSRAENIATLGAAIRDYIKAGGLWLHTGSYPFFHVLEPQPYLQVSASYPPAFSDFLHIEAGAAHVSIFGVREKDAIFVPGKLSARGTATGGELTREFVTWAPHGKSWSAPAVRISLGSPVADSIRAYAKANGFDRPLKEKIEPAVLEKLKRSVLLKYAGRSYKQQAEVAALLPTPLLYHTSDYLQGGFDKQYPDHLPPRASFGTPEDFGALIRSLQQAGNLYMPYTNPTWWCDDPPGPTFVKHGDAPLSKNREGQRIKEAYDKNFGWSLCTFHPAALDAEATILKQFTREYPVDLLFQDQVGARSPIYDFNPAAPTPYAYLQGMIDIAKRDSQKVPLSTENGYDAVMNWETQFCGITWALVPTEHGPHWIRLWRQDYPAHVWAFSPLALWLGHDKVVFAHHDLGQFVTNRESLAWTLAIGYQLSFRADADFLQKEENRRWLNWLSALQRALGPHIIGAPLKQWSEPTPGVYRAQYGDALVIANTTPRPHVLDAKTTLAAYGFLATKGEISAGCVDRIDGADCPGRCFIWNGEDKKDFDAGR